MRSTAPPDAGETTDRHSSRWRNYAPIAVVAFVGLSTTGVAYHQVTDWERHRVKSGFREAARDRVLVIQREIEYTLGLVQDIGNLFDASREVQRWEFRKFVGPALKRYSSIQALEWIPRVIGTEREAFELAARSSLSWFRIIEHNADGEAISAPARPEHFPIFYVQPYSDNKPALGFDLASDPESLEVLLSAAEAGRMVVSERLPLRQGNSTQFAFVAHQPVYHGSEPAQETTPEETSTPPAPTEEEHPPLYGFAAGIFRIGDIVERSLDNLTPSGIDIIFYDISNEIEEQFLYRHGSRKRKKARDAATQAEETARGSGQYTQTLEVANRQWKAVCSPIAGQFQPDPWSGWLVLIGGLAFTALLTVYLSTLVGRAAQVRRLVGMRTAQLLHSNKALNSEIAERIRAETQLQRLNATLERRVAKRSAEAERRAVDLEQFAYVTSHDLKAPLRAIANLAGWLAEDLADKLTDETREQLNLLRDRVGRMHALIEGLLTYSRVGHTESTQETVDTAQLLEEIVDSLSPPAGFAVEIGPGMPTLSTDRLQLGQVFANLISNSLKHHGGGQGHVWVKMRDQGDSYEFSVADDGPGIATEYHDKVFMMFQTLSTKDFGSDTGIGLALVRKIVQEQGGSITLDSKPGEGATFRFTWPKVG